MAWMVARCAAPLSIRRFRSKPPKELSRAARQVNHKLHNRRQRRRIARADAEQAEIILHAADGLNNGGIADAVGVNRKTVRAWHERFVKA
jgi:DNA-directed RNA polymerase specialized sigma24 family protein